MANEVYFRDLPWQAQDSCIPADQGATPAQSVLSWPQDRFCFYVEDECSDEEEDDGNSSGNAACSTAVADSLLSLDQPSKTPSHGAPPAPAWRISHHDEGSDDTSEGHFQVSIAEAASNLLRDLAAQGSIYQYCTMNT
jgi:hypothetical protein